MIAWFLYFSMNSSAPEKAIWLMYLSTSSAVMPMPRSVTVSVFCALSTATWIVRSPSSPFTSPIDERVLSFCVASTAFEMSSRRKISCSE